MRNGSRGRRALTFFAGLMLGAAVFVLPAVAQAPAAKPANCNAYKLDEKKNQVLFNDTRVVVMMPEKADRDRLRTEGTPGQLFLMKNCDSPDLEGEVEVFAKKNDDTGEDPPEKVPSAVRVVILAEETHWVQVKGYTKLWKGTGWVRRSDKLVVVKY